SVAGNDHEMLPVDPQFLLDSICNRFREVSRNADQFNGDQNPFGSLGIFQGKGSSKNGLIYSFGGLVPASIPGKIDRICRSDVTLGRARAEALPGSAVRKQEDGQQEAQRPHQDALELHDRWFHNAFRGTGLPYTSIQSTLEHARLLPPVNRSVQPISSTLLTSGFTSHSPSTILSMSSRRQ